jgi:hypothetical protein
MGTVFYDMGFLSSADVIECSASDLIAPYVGQTAGCVRAQFDKGLGKVLFIDEAYRLADGGFATEAVNEIVDILTKPKYAAKMIVILAGYDQDMNKLLAVNAGLSSRFPEEILFRNMSPEVCLELLHKELKRKKIDCLEMEDPTCAAYKEILKVLTDFSSLPSWGNCRDIITLGKAMAVCTFKKAGSSKPTKPTLTVAEALEVMRTMYAERKDRCENVPADSTTKFTGIPQTMNQSPPKPHAISTSIVAAKQEKSETEFAPPPVEEEETGIQPDQDRDAGVPDDIWKQLQADKAAEEQALRAYDDTVRRLEAAKTAEAAQAALKEKLARAKAMAKDEAERNEALRKLEKARVKELEARAERERAAAALAKALKEEQERKRREAQAQEKLRAMGVCVAGFRWIKQSQGYRCAGGTHFVSNIQLGI